MILLPSEIDAIIERAATEGLQLRLVQHKMLDILSHTRSITPVWLYLGPKLGHTTLWGLIQRSLPHSIIVCTTKARANLIHDGFNCRTITEAEFNQGRWLGRLAIFDVGGYYQNPISAELIYKIADGQYRVLYS